MTTETDNMFLLNRNNYPDNDDFYRVYYDHIEIMDLVQKSFAFELRTAYQNNQNSLPR